MEPNTDWKIIRWETVRGVAKNDFTRVVVLIPIAGYLILFNDEIARMVSFDTLAGVGETDSSPFLLDGLTKLRLVFFGSILVLFSFLIYRLFRPEVLEASKNDLEFSELVRQRYSVTAFMSSPVSKKAFIQNFGPNGLKLFGFSWENDAPRNRWFQVIGQMSESTCSRNTATIFIFLPGNGGKE